MKFWGVLVPALFLVGCQTLPKVDFTWPKTEQDKKIVQLEGEVAKTRSEYKKLIEEKESLIVLEKTDKISKGASQVYAAYGTLEADPEPSKYVDAASGALVVAKEALPVPNVKDLLNAIEIQKKLLSEQAEQIREGKVLLGEASQEVLVSKNKISDLEKEKTQIEKEKETSSLLLQEKLEVLVADRNTERQGLLNEMNAQAAAYRESNSFWKRINPLNGLGRTLSSLMFWVVLLVVIGGGLKIASVFFPGVGIVQAVVGGAGRIIGGTMGMLFKWIPDALRGMSAVDYNKFKVEKDIANNSVSAIQNFKNENPEDYIAKLKPKLKDQNWDDPELKAVIAKKIKNLNRIQV